MEHRTDEFNQARSRMAGDIKTVINDGEDMLRAAADASGASISAAHAKISDKLSSAKATLVDASRSAVEKARSSASAADGYVHANPWPVIGIAVVAGALIALLATRR